MKKTDVMLACQIEFDMPDLNLENLERPNQYKLTDIF